MLANFQIKSLHYNAPQGKGWRGGAGEGRNHKIGCTFHLEDSLGVL